MSDVLQRKVSPEANMPIIATIFAGTSSVAGNVMQSRPKNLVVHTPCGNFWAPAKYLGSLQNVIRCVAREIKKVNMPNANEHNASGVQTPQSG